MSAMSSSAELVEPTYGHRKATNLFLWCGALIVGLNIALAVFGEVVSPASIDDQDLLGLLAPPSSEHLLGTDPLGRDVLSRTILGTRYTMSAALLSVSLAALLGVPFGAMAGFFGGRIDAVISTFVDVLLTIPLVILAIAIASVLGSGLFGLVMATSISFAPRLARLIRGRVIEIRDAEYILASRALGMTNARIIFRHVLPNTFTVATIEITLLAGQAVLIATALGFLGLGVQPPIPEWGTMLGEGREYMEIAPHLVVAPGMAITILVLGFNILGDGLRDLVDPASNR
jgi:ABC-type dipeptide/oligopeptide/nickel transport system permease subunit